MQQIAKPDVAFVASLSLTDARHRRVTFAFVLAAATDRKLAASCSKRVILTVIVVTSR